MQKNYWAIIATATILVAGLSFAFPDKLQIYADTTVVNDSSQCSVIEHWDKVIFAFPTRNVVDNFGTNHQHGSVFDYKFLQTEPVSVPTDITQLTVSHLDTLGWKYGNGDTINKNGLSIIDVDYTVICLV